MYVFYISGPEFRGVAHSVPIPAYDCDACKCAFGGSHLVTSKCCDREAGLSLHAEY